jgi:hypothetical protein
MCGFGVLLLLAAAPYAMGQGNLQVRPADPITLPLEIDSNTATFWRGPNFNLFTSVGHPVLTTIGDGIVSERVKVDSSDHFPMWIESVYDAGDGTLYAWYHYERIGVCPGTSLTAPEIGALVSYDGGRSFTDLGIVLKSAAPVNCSAQNGYFTTGHGDFSVIPDRGGEYFYFLIGSYGGEVAQQGVAIARMAIEDLDAPAGRVWKYYGGSWSQPGIGGIVTPVFPATVGWQAADTDSFWGPSVHWNTYLEKYVVVMNRACCEPGWPQEGVYLSMTADLSDPASWSAPVKILEYGDWYPWVLGTAPGETSAEAGRVVRLFVRNFSDLEIVFQRDGDNTTEPIAKVARPLAVKGSLQTRRTRR